MISRKFLAITALLIVLVGSLGVPVVLAADEVAPTDIAFDVAPGTLNLNQCGQCVTMHAALKYADGNMYEWFLNG